MVDQTVPLAFLLAALHKILVSWDQIEKEIGSVEQEV